VIAADHVLLTPVEMAEADRRTIAVGTAGSVLMERAGAAVADAVRARWSPRPVLVLCGPGNNGGDGFVAARLLEEAGWSVRLMLLGPRERLGGDAAIAAARWAGPVETLDADALGTPGLIVDALFGAGLDRPPDGAARVAIDRVKTLDIPVVAVDVPSGLDGGTGLVLGVAAPAAVTVTFFRPKPGHLVFPGRALCGALVVADIGIASAVLDGVGPRTWENHPALWLHHLPRPSVTGHKYDRGHAAILAGGMSGAARLAARAARRIGVGLLTLVAPEDAYLACVLDQPGAIVVRRDAWEGVLDDPRIGAVLLGPGSAAGPALRQSVVAAARAGKTLVLDAGAVTGFAGSTADLARLHDGRCVLTPHQGEFDRLFGPSHAPRIDRVRAAAKAVRAVVVLKGADTMIASADGRLAINANAPPDLATAGAGDVLAGMVLGLMAQAMPPFEAAAAAVWMHGAAGAAAGRGLIAEDLPGRLPQILRDLDRRAD
jgi:hydroxyethylthiazole kinase-like uncharacterized protein yjeF